MSAPGSSMSGRALFNLAALGNWESTARMVPTAHAIWFQAAMVGPPPPLTALRS